MARTRRAAAKPLHLVIAGSGELSAKAITALLDDLTDGREVGALFVPVTDAAYTDAIADVVKWAVKNGIGYNTMSSEDALDDEELKDVIDGAKDDFDAGDDLKVSLLEMIDDKDADNRVLMFFNGESDDDADLFEAAHDADIAVFDFCDRLGPITFGDDEPEEAEKEEEPEPEAPAPSRRRRAAKEEEPEEEPEAAGPGDLPTETRAELMKLNLVELKKRAKALNPNHTTNTLRGLDKNEIADLLLGTGPSVEDSDEEPADEAQGAPTTKEAARASRAARGASAAAPETDEEPSGEEDSREVVFARLRGSRETAERIGLGLTASARASLELDTEATEEFEKVAGVLAGALMLFADFLVTEVRKPKSAGRPRKDGTEAQPAEKPRRGRTS